MTDKEKIQNMFNRFYNFKEFLAQLKENLELRL